MKKGKLKAFSSVILLKPLLISFFLIQFSSSNISALFLINNDCAKSSAMGDSLSFISRTSDDLLSGKNRGELNIGFTRSRLYNIEELELYSFDFFLTLNHFSLILEIQNIGFDLYREMSIQAGFLFRFFNYISLGITLNRKSLMLNDIGEEHHLSVDIFTSIFFNNKFRVALILQNITSPQFGIYEKDKLEMKLDLEFKWGISFDFELFFKIKDFNNESFKIGFDYQVHKGFFIRCGFSDNPNFFTLGLGIEFKSYKIDYAFKNSLDDLGSTHFISLNFAIKTSNESTVLKKSTRKGYSQNGKININKADRKTLLKLPGISKKLADRIISYRQFRTRFRHIREICRIRGIAYKKYRKIMKYIAVDENGSRLLSLKNTAKSKLNINSITMKQLLKIGIIPLIARNIVLFIRAGGVFKKYEDLKHIPGIDRKSKTILNKYFFGKSKKIKDIKK